MLIDLALLHHVSRSVARCISMSAYSWNRLIRTRLGPFKAPARRRRPHQHPQSPAKQSSCCWFRASSLIAYAVKFLHTKSLRDDLSSSDRSLTTADRQTLDGISIPAFNFLLRSCAAPSPITARSRGDRLLYRCKMDLATIVDTSA